MPNIDGHGLEAVAIALLIALVAIVLCLVFHNGQQDEDVSDYTPRYAVVDRLQAARILYETDDYTDADRAAKWHNGIVVERVQA